jgi:hypothetical protein
MVRLPTELSTSVRASPVSPSSDIDGTSSARVASPCARPTRPTARSSAQLRQVLDALVRPRAKCVADLAGLVAVGMHRQGYA